MMVDGNRTGVKKMMRRAATMVLVFLVLLISFYAFTDAIAQTRIKVHMFRDDNQNGVQNSGETGVSNWYVQLHLGSGCRSPIAETRTNGDGDAVFIVNPGSYSVGVEFVMGWAFSSGMCQDVEIDRDSVTVFFGNFRIQ